MAGIYIHFPFCKQACHYCNFYFSTKMKNKEDLIFFLKKEIDLRYNELRKDTLESVYFGGGSPSLLSLKEIDSIISKVKEKFIISKNTEMTLELNPDDVSMEYIKGLKKTGINRLSLGIQSFLEKDLLLMNRNHTSIQSLKAIEIVSEIFENYSVDLIYGIPESSLKDFMFNIKKALEFDPKHFSCYALTVEPKTVLDHKVKNKKIIMPIDELIKKQFDKMISILEDKKYLHYEISNFAKSDFQSVNNCNYWLRKPYLGIGPSAHSFDGHFKRSWNVSNINLYMKSIKEGELCFGEENLTISESYNEYIMLGLRTSSGVSLRKIEKIFGSKYLKYFMKQIDIYIDSKMLSMDGDIIKITANGKFISDKIASDLFKL
ncbi:MAG: coproporphyrinogen III oxidase [Flavobacteriaceae bacterium]|nr:coproporphyrinogen III oxidase [Flavobacteriaceae bacterium]